MHRGAGKTTEKGYLVENVLCSVFDQKARLFSAPFTSATVETAVRDFGRAVSDTRNMVDKWPADYVLYGVGLFNTETGTVSPHMPQLLAHGSDYLLEGK